MKPYITIANPRYTIESVKGDYFDVFSKRKSAIKAAIRFAAQYSGQTFVVVQEVNRKRKIIFSIGIDAQMDFDDLRDFYSNMVEVYQSKLDKTKYWRRFDGSDS